MGGDVGGGASQTYRGGHLHRGEGVQIGALNTQTLPLSQTPAQSVGKQQRSPGKVLHFSCGAQSWLDLQVCAPPTMASTPGALSSRKRASGSNNSKTAGTVLAWGGMVLGLSSVTVQCHIRVVQAVRDHWLLGRPDALQR